MIQTYLISENYLKTNSPIPLHLDDKYIKNGIIIGQDMHIRPILGKKLYNELLVQASGSTLTAENLELLDNYIQPALLYTSIYELLPSVRSKITPAGVVQMTGEGNTTSDEEQYKHLRNVYYDRCSFYKEELRVFLCDNSTSYPSYTTPGTGSMDSPLHDDQYNFGVIFDVNPYRTTTDTFII